MSFREISVPSHYSPEKVGEVWKVPYQERAEEAGSWAEQYHIKSASN